MSYDVHSMIDYLSNSWMSRYFSFVAGVLVPRGLVK